MAFTWFNKLWRRITGRSKQAEEEATAEVAELVEEEEAALNLTPNMCHKMGVRLTSEELAYVKATRRSDHQVAVDRLQLGMGNRLPTEPRLPLNISYILSQGWLCAEELWEYFDAAGIKVYLPANKAAFMDASGKASLYGETEIKFKDLRFQFNGNSDLVEMVDAWGDIMVIATGGLSQCGVSDYSLLKEIDDNNLLKIANGHMNEHGKFIKPVNHPRPDITGVLKQQGWGRQEEEDKVKSVEQTT